MIIRIIIKTIIIIIIISSSSNSSSSSSSSSSGNLKLNFVGQFEGFMVPGRGVDSSTASTWLVRTASLNLATQVIRFSVLQISKIRLL